MRELTKAEVALVAGGDSYKTNLSSAIDDMLAKSWNAQFDMDIAHTYNYHYQWTDSAKSYTDTVAGVIYISNQYQNNTEAAVMQVSHELGHAVQPSFVPANDSREAYQQAGYLWEAHAIEVSLAINYDLEQQGIHVPVPSASQEAANIYVHAYATYLQVPFTGDMTLLGKALQQEDATIADAVCRLEKTGDGQSYADYYGHEWDIRHSGGSTGGGGSGGIGNVNGGGYVPVGPGTSCINPTVTVGDLLR
jgi:hypothetical protein